MVQKTGKALPRHPLSDLELALYAKQLKIPYFRGVFMIDTLPKRPHQIESGIVNLDKSKNSGTHWVAYFKRLGKVSYYDSFGNLKPPPEILKYFRSSKEIAYNYNREQSFNSIVCGHLCLKFLIKEAENLN